MNAPRSPHPTIPGRLLAGGLIALLVGCAAPSTPAPSAPPPPPEAAPTAVACPEGVPAGARCLRGMDSAKAPYLIVMPEKWSGVLVVHAHGGPFLGAPTDARADADIKRWAITVHEGHAWAGSVFRQGGFAVTTAAEDTERVRRIFVDHVAKPRRTLLHGQSWGGMVATRAAEMYPKSWDGMLLSSAVVAGPANYDFRIDIRALYQLLCNNHPRPDEPAYPLSIGLPADSKLTNADLAARVEECLALRKPAAQRTPEQAQKIKTLVDVLRIPENAIGSNMIWATFTLRDVAQRSGGSPFHNANVRYTGSSDDAALNQRIQRFAPDTAAAKRFAADTDHAGRFAMPVLSTHGIGDSTAFVEAGDTLRRRMEAAGNGRWLVQTFVQSNEHSYLGDATYPPLFEALLNWVEKGERPSALGIAQRCTQRAAAGTAAAECRFMPEFVLQPLATRIAPR